MKVGFIACWCHMRIYSIQASHVRRSLEKIIGSEIEVTTSNCGCFYGGVSNVFQSFFNYKSLLADQDISTFVRVPHFRQKAGSVPGSFLRSTYRRIAEPWRVRQYSEATKNCDIVHFHQSADAFGYDALKGILEGPRDQKRVVTIYGLAPVQKENRSLNSIYNKANVVIVSTNYMKRWLVKDGVQESKLHVIPYGASLKPVEEKPRSGAIMFAGSPLIGVKGFTYLAEAMRILKEKGYALNLKMHGYYMPGHKEWAIETAKKEGVEDQIIWLSFNSEDELISAYQGSQCCVIPYTDYPGCFPVTVAMANATPVIASDSMGIPEYVNGAGVVVKSKSSSDLAAAIERVVKDDSLRAKMGAEGRRTAEMKYSWDVLSKQIYSVYKQVLSQ